MERARVLRAEVRHFCSRRPGHHARPARVRTARCSLHWCRRGSAELPFVSGDSRKRWPGPGQDASPVNPQWSAERRAALVMRVAAVPGNGCSFPQPCLATGTVRRSALRFPRYRGSKMEMPRLRQSLRTRDTFADANASRERDRLTLPCRGRDARRRCAGRGSDRE